MGSFSNDVYFLWEKISCALTGTCENIIGGCKRDSALIRTHNREDEH